MPAVAAAHLKGSLDRPDRRCNALTIMAEFPATSWTLLQRAGQEGTMRHDALEELCRLYRGPLVSCIMAWPALRGAAEDLVQEFLAGFIAADNVEQADRTRGTFRGFLSGALRHFLLNHLRHGNAARRGGGQVHLSLDEGTVETPVDFWPEMEAHLDAAWAARVWEQALAAVQHAWLREHPGTPFSVMAPYLSGGEDIARYREAAAGLGLSVDQMKRRVGELRRLLRGAIREEVERTTHPADAEDEMRYLMQLLSRQPSV